MKTLIHNSKNFEINLKKKLEKRLHTNNQELEKNVKKIISEVKKKGDKALLKYSKKFDKINLKNNFKLNINSVNNKIKVNDKILQSFKKAIINITRFHKKQYPKNITQNEKNINLKSRWLPIDSVGLYIPGGKAFYPSSLIMNVIPAKIAGVKRIVCVTPPSKNINPYFIALLKLLNIRETYFVGGAQAIAALAIGTEKIKPVNKIFGPGNNYVAEAKKQLFGRVGIDLIAGPSEIIVVANNDNNPKWVASDLMAQAEHDPNAQSILITDDNKFAYEVKKQIKILSNNISKRNIINQSLDKNGLIILVKRIQDSVKIINDIAPEHLHLQIKSYKKLLPYINNAGGIFLGEYSAEAFGDYIVGTNHVLPTSGSAKFSSGLGVLDFMKRNSIVELNSKSYKSLKKDTENMAEIEGLQAHQMSVKIRQNK